MRSKNSFVCLFNSLANFSEVTFDSIFIKIFFFFFLVEIALVEPHQLLHHGIPHPRWIMWIFVGHGNSVTVTFSRIKAPSGYGL